MVLENIVLQDRDKFYNDCISRLNKKKLQEQKNRMRLEIQQAEQTGDIVRVQALLEEFNKLISKN